MSLVRDLILFFQWRHTLSQIQGPDWFAIFFGLFGIIYGMRKGMMREFVEIVELLMIIFFAFSLYAIALGFMSQSLMISSERIAPLIFLLCAWLIWMAIAFLDKLFSPYFSSKLPNALKSIGGGILGIFHFFLIWAFLSQAILLIPSQKAQAVYEDKKSLTGPAARELPRKIHQSFSEFLKVPGTENKPA